MKLYPIPGGLWAGTEADWKKALRARGLDPKDFPAKIREVPVDKAGLMEFLNFFAVDVFRTGPTTVLEEAAAPLVDVEELRRLHNPEAMAAMAGDSRRMVDAPDLDQLFAAAPIGKQLQLVVVASDNALALLAPR